MIRHSTRVICFACAAVVFGVAVILRAANATPAEQSTFDRLIHALQIDDRASILSTATDEMKQTITASVMDNVSHDIGPHLSAGYQASLLGELSQRGCHVQLWKVTFKDGHDDLLARVAMNGDKLAGFFIQ